MKFTKINYIFIVIFAVIAAYFIPMSFTKSATISDWLDNILHLKIDPDLSGGEVLVKFLDPVGDDYGEGTLTYPDHREYNEKEYLDIVRYTVHKPSTVQPLYQEADIWQLGFTFYNVSNPFNAKHGFSHPVINVYIDIDGKKSGSTSSVHSDIEKIKFDKEHPWDFMVHVDGYKDNGYLVSFDGKVKDPVRIIYVEKTKTIYAQIPLLNKKIRSIFDGRTTWHYVLIGAYDNFTKSNFMPVEKKYGVRHGGGAHSKLTPGIYDYVAPEGHEQKDILSSYDGKTGQFAKLIPIEVNEQEAKPAPDPDLIKKYTALAENEKIDEKIINQKKVKKLIESGAKQVEIASSYFFAKEYKEAEKLFDNILKKDPENPRAIAYKGALTALKAKTVESKMKKLDLINEAYELFDRAVEKAQGIDKIYTRMLRGNVSMGVPEMIFHKSLTGAEDFIQSAKLFEKIKEVDKKRIAGSYINAAKCYENAGLNDTAEIYFMKAMSVGSLSYQHKLELAKRGFWKEK